MQLPSKSVICMCTAVNAVTDSHVDQSVSDLHAIEKVITKVPYFHRGSILFFCAVSDSHVTEKHEHFYVHCVCMVHPKKRRWRSIIRRG